MYTRRDILRDSALTFIAVASVRSSWANSAAQSAAFVMIENFSPDGRSQGLVRVAKIHKTEEEWRKQLSPDSYVVTRRAGTERAFSGPLWNQHGDGLYHCICCETVLYDSRTKFESGTGWPSFYAPANATAVATDTDRSFFMTRTEAMCANCGGHLGHVFDDGPNPTGLRYCINSASLKLHTEG